MGYSQKAVKYFEPEDYLLLENLAKNKHEYMDGVIYEWQGTTIRGMAGASADHVTVCLNVAIAFRSQIGERDCQVFATDMRVRPDGYSSYFYPDVAVRCGPKVEGKTKEIDDACIIVEVLSETSEGFDRQDKFVRYKRMASLETYVLIDPNLRTIEVIRRALQWRVVTDAGRYDLGLLDIKLDPDAVFKGV